jgi:hypothetical protein
MLCLQTYFTKKKKKKLLQTNVAQYDWVSQNLNLSHIQLYCATSICKIFFFFIFFLKCVYKPNISLFLNHVEGLLAVVQEAC